MNDLGANDPFGPAFAPAQPRTRDALAEAIRRTPGRARAGAASTFRTAWQRPGPVPRRGAGAGSAPSGGQTFHFRVHQSSSPRASVRHQGYIERDGACVASFGTISEEFETRCHLWEAIGARAHRRRGSVILTDEAPDRIKETVAARLPSSPFAGLLARDAPAPTPGKPPAREMKWFTPDPVTHDRILAWLETLGVTNRARQPPALRHHRPQAGVVQRRIVIELAHELPLADQTRILRQWCDASLDAAGARYHAVIHRPEHRNDERNWHAHVVFASIPVRELADEAGRPSGRFDFEAAPRKLPKTLDLVRELTGNSPAKRRGSQRLFRAWRARIADLQNRALAAAGAAKRYDPRSYAAMGRTETPGHHLGPARHATARTDLHPLATGETWTRAGVDLGKRLAAARHSRETIARHLEHLERIRIQLGLAAQNLGPHAALWGAFDRARRPEHGLLAAERLDDALAQHPRATVPEPPWEDAWRAAQGIRDRDLRAFEAARIVAGAGGGRALRTARSNASLELLGAARIWHETARPWRRRWNTLAKRPPDAARDTACARLEARFHAAGIARPEWLLDRVTARTLFQGADRHRRRTRAAREIPNTIARLRTAVDPNDLDALWRPVHTRHAQWLDEDAPQEGARAARTLEQCRRAAHLRLHWRGACRAGPAAVARFADASLSTADRSTIECLNPEEFAHMRRAGEAPSHAQARQREADAAARATLARLAPGPGAARTGAAPSPSTIDAVAGDDALRTVLRTGAPHVESIVAELARDLTTRRRALGATIRRYRAGSCEPGSLLALDPTLLASDAPTLVRDIAHAIAARANTLASIPSPDATRRLAELAPPGALATLAVHLPETARAIAAAHTAEAALVRTRQARAGALRRRLERHRPSDAEAAELHQLLENPDERARIGPEGVRALERLHRPTDRSTPHARSRPELEIG